MGVCPNGKSCHRITFPWTINRLGKLFGEVGNVKPASSHADALNMIKSGLSQQKKLLQVRRIPNVVEKLKVTTSQLRPLSTLR